MNVVERSLQGIGKSLLVTLPKQWTRSFALKKGSKLKMLVSEQGSLLLAPELSDKQEKKESIIVYDSGFARKFYRDYFYGNEKITIKLDKLAEKQRKELHDFLKFFMNVQVVEETDTKIVVKCFKIEELSIEECLRRMYFISLNMFDSYSRESRDTMTRFYYMLIMQVRRYLSEGKFASQNIPIIRAMDIRMVAEKIQRVGELLEKAKPDKTVKDYYSRAFNSFINSDFDKAFGLFQEYKIFRNKDPAQKQITRYAKEISMLVR